MNYKDNDEYLSSKELDKRLFSCADVLRGSIDSGRYKDFVLPLVFYAAVNGWREQKREQLSQEKENKPFTELPEGKQQYFTKLAERESNIKIPEEYTWDKLARENKNIATKIDNYFLEFQKENSERYSEIFNNNYTSIGSFKEEDGDQLLNELIRKINEIDFERIPPDMMGESYMNLVKRFSEAEGGEYFTPPKVVDLMVQLLEPFEKSSSFHDPTVGSGGMLIEAAQHIRKQYEGKFEDGDDNTSREKLNNYIDKHFEFTGQEKNPTIAGIAKMNLALHGLKGNIKRGDSLTNPQFTDKNNLDKFDYIFANFPFSTNGWKSGATERQGIYGDLDWAENGKLPHGNYGDFTFIMHMESQLAENGQLATVIPHGVLFRNGDKKYREYLIENDLIEAIVGLPENMFEATGIPSGILILNKDKPEERKGEVMFFNTDHEDRFYYDTGSSRNKLIDKGITEIKEFYDYWGKENRVCNIVDVNEIKENDYNLNIALYVDTTEPQENINVSDVFDEIDDLENKYDDLKKQLDEYRMNLEY